MRAAQHAQATRANYLYVTTGRREPITESRGATISRSKPPQVPFAPPMPRQYPEQHDRSLGSGAARVAHHEPVAESDGDGDEHDQRLAEVDACQQREADEYAEHRHDYTA